MGPVFQLLQLVDQLLACGVECAVVMDYAMHVVAGMPLQPRQARINL
jgi:hypothetical protein